MSSMQTFMLGFFTIVAAPCVTGCLMHWEVLTSGLQPTFTAIAVGVSLSFAGIVFLATGVSRSVEEDIVEAEVDFQESERSS